MNSLHDLEDFVSQRSLPIHTLTRGTASLRVLPPSVPIKTNKRRLLVFRWGPTRPADAPDAGGPTSGELTCVMENELVLIMDRLDFRKSEDRMDSGNRSLEEILIEEFHRHLMAHSVEMATGMGRPGCQFCPSLPLSPELEPSEKALLDPGQFQMAFCRELAKTINEIYSNMLSGHLRSTKFLWDLKKKLKNKPWDKPPASPGAILPKLFNEGDTGIRATA